MAAVDVGRLCLFVQSILQDLDIPQEAATVTYEDNEGCIAMGNAQKPTTHTCHIDIKYLPSVTGWSGILFSWKGSTRPSILRTTLPKSYPTSFFINMPTIS